MYMVDEVYVVSRIPKGNFFGIARHAVVSVWSSSKLAEAAILLHENLEPEEKFCISKCILNSTIKPEVQ